MITIHSAHSRYSAKNDWLQSNFSFSFADYYDSENLNFGPLRVLNDDIIQPQNGFGIHPHREAEVISIVLKGQLKHEDSMGNNGILHFGEVQRMTAGTGILHSEVNPTTDEETHILQLWFFPNEKQLPPSYEEASFDLKGLSNQLLPIVSQNPSENVAKIHQDVTIYLSKLGQGNTLDFKQKEGRKIYLFVIDGELNLNNEEVINRRDDARITDTPELKVAANKESFFMLIDLPGGE
jgi:quercetin 2,3-dioxygenase